jgi:hypothetical protein
MNDNSVHVPVVKCPSAKQLTPFFHYIFVNQKLFSVAENNFCFEVIMNDNSDGVPAVVKCPSAKQLTTFFNIFL